MKKSVKTALTRITSVLLLGALCATAVLYQRGVFDFSFYNRNNIKEDDRTSSAEITEVPVDTTAPDGVTVRPDTYALQFTDALKAAKNISNVGAGILKGGNAVQFEYSTLSKLLADGYVISYGDYDQDENMVLCRIDADIDAEYNENGYSGTSLYFYAEASNNYTVPKGKRTMSYTIHKGVYLYMGYIITDNGKEQTIYSSTGEKLYTTRTDGLIPALTRDNDGHPLFHSTDDEFEGYYYIDENKELKVSDYNDQTDNRGLYFDYVPTYGLADNDIVKYNTMVTIATEITSMIEETESPFIETAEPEITDTVTTEPEITEDVTDEVTVFVEETTEAPPEETAPAETEAETTEDTAEKTTEETAEETAEETEEESEYEEYPGEGDIEYDPINETIPVEDTEYIEDTEEDTYYEDTDYIEDDTYYEDTDYVEDDTYYDDTEDTSVSEDTTEEAVTGEVTVDVTVDVTGEITEAVPADTTAEISEDPVTEEITEEVTTEDTTEDTTEVTTEAPPQYVVVDTVYSEALRFAYAYSQWYFITNYTFMEAYNYSEGLAAVVYPDNVMLFLTEWGANHYPLYREGNYWNENGRLAFSIYTAPLVRDISDIGSLYFDRGYVRVRQLDTDAVYGNPDYLIGQYDLLLDKDGEIFKLPADYEIVGYSDGVLLLERDGLYGYYSTEGRWIAQPIYTFARPFAEGLGVIGFENGIKGVIDTAGNVVIPFNYTEISQVSTGVIAAYGEKNDWEFFAKVTLP